MYSCRAYKKDMQRINACGTTFNMSVRLKMKSCGMMRVMHKRLVVLKYFVLKAFVVENVVGIYKLGLSGHF